VIVFLDASEKKYQQEEQNKVRLQRMELNRTRKFAVTMLFAAMAFLFISVWGFQQRGDAIKKAREADSSREEAEFRKKESDSLRKVAEGRASLADMEKLIAQITADSAERKRALALYQSKISEQEKMLAFRQAEEATRKSEVFQKEKEDAVTTAEIAIEQQSVTEKEKNLEGKKRMLSIALTMAGKVTQVDDKNLKGLLAQQAFLFNRDYDGQTDHPDIYSALYNALNGFNGDNFNGLQGHEGAIRSLAFLPASGVFYSSGGDGKILRWDLNGNTKSYRTLIDNNFINRSLAISANGRWLACGTTTNGIQLFNLNTANISPSILQGHKSWVVALSFTPDSKGLYSASEDKSIIYWDLITGANSVFITLESTKVRCLAVSPSGRYIFGGTDDGKLIRWNMDSKEETVVFSSDNNSIYAIAFNSTGSRIAFVDKSGTLRLADARTNSIVKAISAHTARIVDVKFSPDDRQIATCSMDYTFKIWDANNLTNRPIVSNKHNYWVLSVAFSPDGKYLVTSGDVPKGATFAYIYYWPTHSAYMAEQMCGKIGRNFSQREWETYVSYDIPYQKTCPNK
jgi:dipeptidyl aminopeptidase/acylaminoacyl peptidase